MTRSIALAFTLVSGAALGDVPTLVEGDVRVQALSPTLVRIELRGPEGFEDRATFHVVRRDWPAAPGVHRERTNERGRLVTRDWSVSVPRGAKDVREVRIMARDGRLLYAPTGKETARAWLPAPGSRPQTWAFADAPRFVPPSWGAAVPPNDEPNSGWDVANGAPDLYVFLPNGSYRTLRRDFLRLTGPSEMPPLFMLGLIDSRYHPYTDREALAKIDTYRSKKIPLDVLTIDTNWRIGASHGYAPDPQFFPDMPGFLREAHAKGVRTMFNDHPEPQTASALDPAESRYRWAGLTGLRKSGLDVWWYDRNWSVGLREPAPGLPGHVWGMRVYHDMAAAFRPTERPVILANVDGIDNGDRNRPPDVAAHRFSMQWTGDTHSRWADLRQGVANAVQGGVEGLNPWMSEDLGGHQGHPSAELYTRFMQYGALSPVMRPHGTFNEDRAPWAYGPEVERIVGDAARLRYRLLPVFYAAAREAYDTGEPIVRRLDLDFPSFVAARRDDQYLLGRSLLVAPVLEGGETPLSAAWSVAPWRAEYFAGEEPTGSPILTRDEPKPGFDLTRDSVAPNVPADHFAARWSATLANPGPDPARLTMTVDDGCRVWIDGKLVVDRWKPQDSAQFAIPFVFRPRERHAVRIEYKEIDGGATMRLGVEVDRATARRELWIPPGTWIDLWTGRRVAGPRTMTVEAPRSELPVFAKAGGIVPTLPPLQRADGSRWSEVRLEAFAGGEGAATLYEDDGHSVAYRAGSFRTTGIAIRSKGGRATVTISPARGTYAGAPSERAWTLRLHVPAGVRPGSVRVDGRQTPARRLAANPSARTILDVGTAADGDVIEVRLPSRPATRGANIRIAWR